VHYRTLGRSGIEVSLLGFGTGGPTTFTEAGISDADKTRLLRRCLDRGINLIDTSQGYGDSERFLGAALAGVPRDSYLLSTKWAYSQWTGLDSEPVEGGLVGDAGALEQAVDASLDRLRTNYVDVMFIHGLKPEDYDAVYERHGPAIERLKQAGKIRMAGFSERMGDDLEHRVTIDAVTRHPSFWDVSMLRYGILNQCARDRALPLCAEHGVAVMNMSPARHLLPHPEQLVERIAAWKADGSLAADAVPDDAPLGWLVHGGVESVVGAGMKFAADDPGVSTVLTGTRSFDHLEANIRALEEPRLPDADHDRLVRLFSFAREWR
jgi:L-galactose dehydrogenase